MYQGGLSKSEMEKTATRKFTSRAPRIDVKPTPIQENNIQDETISNENENINCSVGAMEQGTNKQLFHDVLYISKTEASIELRIFVDQTFHEAYWQNGRVAMTVNNPQQGDQLVENDVAFRSDGNDELLEVEYVNIYQVDDIWTTTEEILKMEKFILSIITKKGL